MEKSFSKSLALGTALLLSACGSGEDVADQEVAATATAETADDNSPFAASEMQMSERMMAAVGTNVGDSWVRKMIVHHQAAIEMSQIMLQQNPSANVAQMAQDTIDKQSVEIEDLRKLIQEGPANPESAMTYRPAMMSMQQAMMSSTGANVEETFMRKMLAHHLGGVAMSDVALENGASGAVRARVAKTREDQQKEADMIEAMLRGEPMAATSGSEFPASVPPTARESQSPARPQVTSGARPQPYATPPAASTEDPHAGMDMSGQ